MSPPRGNGFFYPAVQHHDARAKDLPCPTKSTSACSHSAGLRLSSKMRERPRFSGCSCFAFAQDQDSQFRTTSGVATGVEATTTVQHVIMVKRRRATRKPAKSRAEKGYRERCVQQRGKPAQDRYLPATTYVPTGRQRIVRCKAHRADGLIATLCARYPGSHAPEKP